MLAVLVVALLHIPHAPPGHVRLALHKAGRSCGGMLCASVEGEVGPSSSPVLSSSKLFIGGIPFGMTEADVSRLFDGVALPHEVTPVLEMCLATDGDGVPRGYGFVELATETQAQRAIKLLNGRSCGYGGRMPTTLVVARAKAGQPIGTPIGGRLLWVGNISWDTRATCVRDAFAAAGGVEPTTVWCNLPKDPRTHRTTGFGTVRFPDAASASRALDSMAGAELDGRALLVRIDRRAGQPRGAHARGGSGLGSEGGSDRSAEIAPVDAIEPELLAALESTQFDAERETRRASLQQRHLQEIDRHRRYLSAVAEQVCVRGRGGHAHRPSSPSDRSLACS